jgi:hypothetical protein
MLQNLSLDKNDTPTGARDGGTCGDRSVPFRRGGSSAGVCSGPRGRGLACRATAACCTASVGPSARRSGNAVEQLLAAAILRDGTGAAVVAASPIIVQAPNAGGVMAPHVSVYTAAENTTLLPRDLVQRFGTRSLCAARSLADRTSQITALRGAGRRSSPTCPTLRV